MKMKRSHRLVYMTHYLLNNPYRTISLPFFVDRYQAAKSSISEDVGIIAEQFKLSNIGIVETIAGASGGVIFRPKVEKDKAMEYMNQLTAKLTDKQRILPGGYFYFSDVLGNPYDLRHIGNIIASAYYGQSIDVIMTMATKGISMAQAVANFLNVPFVIVQREAQLTEGSTVSVTYVTGNDEVKKMALTKNNLSADQNILIVDDFMNGGGTMNGMLSLVEEFDCHTIGAVVFGEADNQKNYIDYPYKSLIKVKKTDDNLDVAGIELGSLFD
ncbi:pur operon repressor [Aerococcus urinae]|uniref:pur operon repressor n=1 Tax=Aerococcus urinae TaxID=1376 RepID=UPI00254B2860|nr:pur operon repressor [Aerococcus urinae]MDK7715504.1 pur operon repressor [Aerococcus urinae]